MVRKNLVPLGIRSAMQFGQCPVIVYKTMLFIGFGEVLVGQVMTAGS